MRNFIRLVFVFAAFFIIANFSAVQAQETSMTILWITNPLCCPAPGVCGANHPVLGPANSQTFNNNGLFCEHICWDTFFPPGTAIVTYWALTMTVEVPNALYVAMYCYGEHDEVIGYGVNLTAYVTTSPVYIYDPDATE